jgi:hypothetical protein
MKPNTFLFSLLLITILGISCSQVLKKPPPRAEVEALLKQEAEAEKQRSESDVNPALGVKISWTIQGVEVREQPGNEDHPWAGTIHFLVESKTPELDGVATERFEKAYEYLWDMERDAWIPQ